MTVKVINPFELFLNARGDLLDGGFVYIGTVGADPEVSPVDVFFDEALSIPAAQPLRTRGGMIVNGPSPAQIFIDEENYSIRTKDSDGSTVTYAASSLATTITYQPLDADLTAIAALTTQAFGRSLLTTANVAAAKTLLEIVASLPLTGGTVTGAIVRGSAGAHLYHGDTALASGKISVIANAAALPSGSNGDVVFRLKA
jgi:hypothetical protein